MYVPGFPAVAGDLGVSASTVQLTLTTFFVGMGLGQLIGGPVSDQRGRRRPLLAGAVVMTVASVACAVAPNAGVLLAARFVQGFGGGWAMVVSRSVIVDVAQGHQLVRALNVIMGVGGIAPIVSPLLGALVLQTWGWRATFWLLAAAGVAMTMFAHLAVPESLPVERRHGGGLARFGTSARIVLGNRRYVGYVIATSASFVSLFAYVAASPFVLQTMNGLDPVGYSIVFAINAAAMTVAALASARLAGRVPTRSVILTGQVVALAAAVMLLAAALWLGTPLILAGVGFLAIMVSQGLINGNAGALASSAVPEHPGTGSAVLGLLQWTTAGIVAPLVGLGGTHTAVPMAVAMVAGAVVSLVGPLVIARPDPGHPLQDRTAEPAVEQAGDGSTVGART
ncbi:multidrug transporter CflA [Tessaracoccus sp. T2.5-30]|nr:multidrug transporter CflA [Tessaracoccus sp. T2.5-30]